MHCPSTKCTPKLSVLCQFLWIISASRIILLKLLITFQLKIDWFQSRDWSKLMPINKVLAASIELNLSSEKAVLYSVETLYEMQFFGDKSSPRKSRYSIFLDPSPSWFGLWRRHEKPINRQIRKFIKTSFYLRWTKFRFSYFLRIFSCLLIEYSIYSLSLEWPIKLYKVSPF
jgi:hypothetical protein